MVGIESSVKAVRQAKAAVISLCAVVEDGKISLIDAPKAWGVVVALGECVKLIKDLPGEWKDIDAAEIGVLYLEVKALGAELVKLFDLVKKFI